MFPNLPIPLKTSHTFFPASTHAGPHPRTVPKAPSPKSAQPAANPPMTRDLEPSRPAASRFSNGLGSVRECADNAFLPGLVIGKQK